MKRLLELHNILLSALILLTVTFTACGSGSAKVEAATSTLTAPEVATSALASGIQGSRYSAALSATGGTSPYTWSLASGALPAGLTLSTAGTISGAPSASGTSSFSVTVKDSEASPQAATASLALTVAAPAPAALQFATSTLASGIQGSSYSATLSASGGTSPYTWSLASGSLPAGLTLSTAGAISGTPSASGTSSFSVTVKDSEASPQAATASLALTIAAPAPPAPKVATTTLAIATGTLASGVQGSSYSATLSASGGTSPYTWSLASGSLPAGLTLSTAGAISGTPSASGTSSFSVTVKDSEASPQAATASLALTIAASAPPAPKVATSTLASGVQGSSYSAALSATGGTSPYTWSLASGSLPAGLTLSTGGAISGTPSASGTSSFSVTVKDSEASPQAATASLALTVAAPAPAALQFATSTLASGTQGSSYSATLSATGGTSPYTWSLASGSLPAGLTLSKGGAISGTPSISSTSSFSVTVKDSEASPQAATASLALTIASAPSSGANNLYVSPTGSDSNPCSQASPCATPAHAFNSVAKPGYTVHVAPGTYSGSFNLTASGSSGNYITLVSDTLYGAVIVGNASGNNAVVELDGNYEAVQGFEITNSGSCNLGIYVAGDHYQIKQNKIHDIHPVGDSNGGAGILVAQGAADDSVLDSNLIYNILGPTTVNTVQGIYVDRPVQAITNNIVYNVTGGWCIQDQQVDASTQGTIISNNLMFGCGNGGLVIANNGANVDNDTITNNIILNNGIDQAKCGIYEWANNGPHSIVRNNNVYGNGGGDYCLTSVSESAGMSVNPSSGTTFVNWQANGSGNYHEAAGSPTIGAGTTACATGTSCAPTNDLDQNSRPATPDIGPYQN